EGMRQLGSKARFIVIGSSEEYGLVYPDELPIRETNPLRPLSPYAVSKVTQDLMGWQYFKSYGMHIVRARAFNHDGPRRGESFATSNFAKQIAEIEAGLREPVVLVGDLKPTRDFSDVRDIVRGYWALLERGTPGEVYNLCSGVDWSIERVLNFLVGKSTAPRIELVHDWLTGMRGGERCLEVVCELFPDAPLFTLIHVPGTVSPVIERRRVVTSFVQRLPAAAVHYRRYLPLFPAAVRRFDLS